ncbi:hypothetical protein [Klebsiella aerogenes]|uniref:hypothetical protein n=1 Tax=Klebsiella aerogenes TaxID=548 RepID=UPI00115C3A55|nr:hypothetical protein [Klebsiella aerogenes]
MTKSTITRERAEQLANFKGAPVTRQEEQELARMALAAMDSEPVAEVLSNRQGNDTSTIDRALPVGTQLYRHAQSAPVVPNFKKLALELVGNLVDCGGLDEGVKERYLEWTEKTCRAAMFAATQEAK